MQKNKGIAYAIKGKERQKFLKLRKWPPFAKLDFLQILF